MTKQKIDTPKKKMKISIIFKSIAGIIIFLVIFSVAICIIGFKIFTDALLEQYYDDALRTAHTAAAELDVTKIEDYANSGGKTEEYIKAWKNMEKICNSSDATFIYVIRPDINDYKHITFLFSTINENYSYERYDFGFVRETTNDDYREKYRKLYNGVSDCELVVRDRGYIETDPHITAMIPLKDSSGKTTAILCVQFQMDELVGVRNNYISKVVFVMIILMIIVIIIQFFYLHRVFLRPVKKITSESTRFSEENKLPDKKLSEIVRNHDEIGVLASSIDTMEERIIKYIDDLTKATAEKERINTELSLATRIQANMLPSIYPPFPDHKEISIYANMEPAKEVGGDFYDFFLIDDDHLCITIADVSGKGIPAALFMMSSKTILSNNAMSGKSPAQILTDTNNAICSNNSEDIFVTVWLGILELSTGKLTAANAGHEYPAVMKPDGKFELLKDKHSFVVGVMSGMKYKDYEIRLEAGSKIFLYTDGVPEATAINDEQFGFERMIDALNEDPSASTEDILKNVKKSVDRFVTDAEQFDDLTMLCLEYKGISKNQ